MRPVVENRKRSRPSPSLAVASGLASLLAAWAAVGADRPSRATLPRDYYEARALFEKVWEPGVPSPSGGDGVGPLFNERSCVGCHNLGGTGGAGDSSKNVTILSAIPGASVSGDARAIFRGELDALHPGFRTRSSVVVHRHSTSKEDEDRLGNLCGYGFVQTRDELFELAYSRRNTPALFGLGKLDAIPDSALIAAEARTFPDFPEVHGRASRLRNGRIGKFGWKGQTATLGDFVLAACANELGLEVRGHHQASLAPSKYFDASTLVVDLKDEETALLTRFVANLPAPVVRPVGDAARGSAIFEAIGCATCHARGLGSVDGLYSDLLLHDLGDRFRAIGGYGGPSTGVAELASGRAVDRKSSGEAGPTEWRTPPLWGVADSAPYLHDGRAPTLTEAITLHGGEAEKAQQRFAALGFEDRQAVLAFLHSLVAPAQPGRPVDRATNKPRGNRK